MRERLKKIIHWANGNKPTLLVMGLVLLLANIFAAYFVSRERYIYFWDWMTFFQKYIFLNKKFFHNPSAALETIFWSIREDRYNYLPTLFLIPFSVLFGVGRISYILAVLNIYALPALVVWIVLIQKIAEKQRKASTLLPWIAIGLILLSPDFWNPILFGLPDIGGVIITNLALLVYLKKPFSEHRKRDLLLIATLISAVVIFRRWYAFWGVSFYLVLLLEIFVTNLLTRPWNKRKIAKEYLWYLLMITVSGTIYYLAVPTYANQILHTNFIASQAPHRYSANYFQSFIVVVNSFGLIYSGLFLLGSITAVINKGTRRFSLFTLCQFIAIFFIFTTMQDFDSHHRYLLLPQVIIFAALFLNNYMSSAGKFKVITLSGLIVLLMLNWKVAFFSQEKQVRRPCPTLFTDIRHQPLVRHDLAEIERILGVLEKLLKETEGQVYVLAGSDILNSGILKFGWTYFHNYKETSRNILHTHVDDLKYGFPGSLLKADYVILPQPPQFSKRPEFQRVLTIPTELFYKREGMAKSFQKMPYEFVLDDNVKVSIYKKIQPISKDDLFTFSEALRHYYPNLEYIYKPAESL